MTFRTCARCTATAVRTLGTEDLCAPCAEAILEPIRARVLERDMLQETTRGRGGQVGPLRTDYGPGWADLACNQCNARWTGRINGACPWCADREEWMLEEQRKLIRTPPDVEREDITYEARMGAWIDRMSRAVEAGIITRDEARWAWERTQRGHGTAA